MAVVGCEGTSGTVLGRNDGAAPQGSNLRLDAFLIRSVSTCAIGNGCDSLDATKCFYLDDGAGGSRMTFAPGTLSFVPSGDPQIQQAAQVACFRLALDDSEATHAEQLLDDLRARVFRDSGGDINLDIRTHVVPSLDTSLSPYDTGIILPASALTEIGLPLVGRDTDFVYAITGYRDPDTGLQPKMQYCIGTDSVSTDGLGASPYTWLGLSDSCAQLDAFARSWTTQAYFANRDVDNVGNDLYRRNYPACGNGDPDPTTWFPDVDDCAVDPDADTCGLATCPDEGAFYTHILAKHWRLQAPFNGNACRDGRMDFSETGVDTGGVCDLIGR